MLSRFLAVAAVLLALGALSVTPVRAQGYRDDPRVTCESRNYNFQRCQMPWQWADAQLIRQTSGAQCLRGRTWGVDRGGLWVDRGCGGVFAPVGSGPNGWYPGPDWNRRFTVGCGSSNYQYQFCAVDVGHSGRISLDRQTSGSACVLGRTWGWNRAGVWVDQGCAGIFTIDRRWW
jgi:Protein of unknown function (DUF3011)